MFNKTIVFGRTHHEYIPYEKTIIEKRAPTDESIRLFDEIKERAYESILETIEIVDNSINLKAIVYRDFSSRELILKYEILLNNKKINGSLNIGEKIDKKECIREIYKELSNNISEKLIMMNLNDIV